MDTLADVVEQEAPKIALSRPEGYGIDALSIPTTQRDTHVIAPNTAHIGQYMVRQRQYGLRMRRTIWPSLLQGFIERYRCTRCGQCAIDGQALVFAQARNDMRRFFFKIGP